MKKWIALLLATLMMVSVVACTKKDSNKPSKDTKEPTTVGEILLADFRKQAGKSAQEIADALIQNSIIEFPPATMAVEPGLLTGFDNAEITGFKEGVMFSPMMGTIPFVGYIFVLDDGVDVDAFKATLEDNANLRWNICTEAEELTVANEGNKVFFLMSPKSFEQPEMPVE